MELLDKLEIEKAGVIAYSAGGASAVQLALNYPERVSHLILISTAISDTEMTLPPEALLKKWQDLIIFSG